MFGLFGLLYNPFLIFIALFVWIGAEQEASMVQVKSALGGIPVSQAMQTHYRTLTANDSLDHAVQMILTGSQQDFPVVDGSEVIGLLTRADLFNALAQRKAVIVGQVMREDFPVATPADPLEESLRKLQASGLQTLVVVGGGALQGLVTTENIGEFLMIHSARRGGISA
jgi:CBS domain-containing protein